MIFGGEREYSGVEWHESFTEFDCFPEEKKHTPRPRIVCFFIFKKKAQLIRPNWKAVTPMRLVERRFHISQQPLSLLPLLLLLLTHSPPAPPPSTPLHSPAPCFVDLSVLARWQCTTAHSCTMRGEKEQNRGFTHEKGDNDPPSLLP